MATSVKEWFLAGIFIKILLSSTLAAASPAQLVVYKKKTNVHVVCHSSYSLHSDDISYFGKEGVCAQ